MRIDLERNVVAILVSLCATLCLIIFSNQYLEGYECLLNSFYFLFAKAHTTTPQLADLNFLFSYPLLWLQGLTQDIGFFSLHKVFTIWVIITFLVKLSLQRRSSFYLAYLFGLILMCVDAFLFIHTNKLVVLLITSGVLCAIRQPDQKKALLVIVFTAVYAVALRVDLALIISALIFLVSVLYFQKAAFKKLSLLFAISVMGFMAFVFLINQNSSNLKNLYTYERAYQDRRDFVLKKRPNDSELTQKELTLYGMAYFLLDEEVQEGMPYSSTVKHQSLTAYVFQNPEFLNIYTAKLLDLWQEVKSRYLVNFILCLSSIIFLCYYHIKQNIPLWKFFTVFLLYVSLPLLINVVAFVNLPFFSAYLLTPFIVAFTWVMHKPKNVLAKYVTLLMIVVLGFVNFTFFVKPTLQDYKTMELGKIQIMEAFRKDISHGLTPVVSYIDYDYFLPASLDFNYEDLDFVFLDAGAYNHLDYFEYTHKETFGQNYTSFAHRVSVVINENGYLYSSKDTLAFMLNYLKKVHDMEVDYLVVQSFGNLPFKKVKLSFPESHNMTQSPSC